MGKKSIYWAVAGVAMGTALAVQGSEQDHGHTHKLDEKQHVHEEKQHVHEEKQYAYSNNEQNHTQDMAHDHDHHAHEMDQYPGWTAHLGLIQHLDNVHHATHAEDEITEAYLHAHLDLSYHFNPNWKFNSSLKLAGHPKGEAGHSHGGGTASADDRWWEEHELMFEQFNLDRAESPVRN